jgi:hypothetical protein
MAKRKKNPHAVALGRAGGKVGGLARVPKGTSVLSPEERVRRAKAASAARWKKAKTKKKAAGGKPENER